MKEQFSARYALARYPSGGVVIDLSSGNYFRVNRTAALVCDALLQGGSAEDRLADELNVSREEASALIAEVKAGLSGPPVRTTPPGAYHFFPVDDGYVLRHGERTVLEVDQAGATIRLPKNDPLQDPNLLEFYVRALAPKLLFQRGVTVLHASACLTKRGRLLAFAGLSGAGKTTTARTFSAAGLRLVSEDLLIFVPGASERRVALEGEAYVHGWARGITAQHHQPEGEASCGDLSLSAAGPAAAVETILCLDRSRRAGEQLSARPLDKPDALVALMTHAFLGAREPENWRRYLASTSSLIMAIDVREATAPDGLERLAAAVPSYISNSAS
jgi:hypothetical protein